MRSLLFAYLLAVRHIKHDLLRRWRLLSIFISPLDRLLIGFEEIYTDGRGIIGLFGKHGDGLQLLRRFAKWVYITHSLGLPLGDCCKPVSCHRAILCSPA